MDETNETNETTERISTAREDNDFLRQVLTEYEERMGARRTPPKGWTYNDVLQALRVSARIRAKLG